MDNTNLWKPHLGQSWPIYPHLMQSVRVTAATVPGPSGGYTSSSMLAALLYIGYVEQLQPNNILPRDREQDLANPKKEKKDG